MARPTTDYRDDTRAATPMSMASRPMTPGTPGTFDSRGSKYASYHDVSTEYNRYDDPSGRTGANRSPSLGGTYYFKEGGGAPARAGGAAVVASASKKNWFRRHPWATGIIVLLVLIVAGVAGGVGGALGSSSSGNKNLSSTNGAASSGSGSSGSGSGSGSSSGSSSGSGSSGGGSSTPAAPKPLTPLAKWNMTDPNSKIVGVSLGNWLVLERWLSEDWVVNTAGDNAWDEWTFTQLLGPTAAKTQLQNHWNTWINESNFDTLKAAGVNAVRIPVGYWAFVPTISNEPYLAQAGQLDQLQKVLGWLYARGMYAMIDLHGMPGSQNGDQSSGHNTSYIGWFDEPNFSYSYTILNATMDWIHKSNYSSVVQWVCPVNEPRTDGQPTKQAQLRTYYENSYNMIRQAGMVMMFHHAFENNPLSFWQSFATGKDPNYISYNSNPYFGWFPPVTSSSTIINSVCQQAQQTQGYPIPIVMTEYSAINGVNQNSFTTQYYNTEVSAWAWSGGSFFWNIRADHSTRQILSIADNNMDEYSFLTLVQNGVISRNINTQQSSLDQIKSLPNQSCGNIPSPSYNNPSRGTGQYA